MRFTPRSYAVALSAATQDGALRDMLTALHRCVAVLGPSGALRALGQPGLSDALRDQLLAAIAKHAELPAPITGLLRTLTALGALRALPRVTSAFDRLAAARGMHRLTVITAAPVTPGTVAHAEAALEAAAAARVGGTVVIQWDVRPALLGGAQLILDDEQLDQSFVTRLDTLQALAAPSTL